MLACDRKKVLFWLKLRAHSCQTVVIVYFVTIRMRWKFRDSCIMPWQWREEFYRIFILLVSFHYKDDSSSIKGFQIISHTYLFISMRHMLWRIWVSIRYVFVQYWCYWHGLTWIWPDFANHKWHVILTSKQLTICTASSPPTKSCSTEFEPLPYRVHNPLAYRIEWCDKTAIWLNKHCHTYRSLEN